MNNVVIDGKIWRDPSSKEVGDTRVTQFAIINTSGKKTYMIGCELWGANGREFIAQYGEGDTVCVSGQLVQFSWDDKGTGKKNNMVRVRVAGYSGGGISGFDSLAGVGQESVSSTGGTTRKEPSKVASKAVEQVNQQAEPVAAGVEEEIPF